MCMEYKKAGMTRTEQVRKRSGRCCLVAKLCPTLCNPMDCSSQAPLSLGFPRQEYWSRLPFPSPGDLPDPGIEPASLEPPALAGKFFTPEPNGNPSGRFRGLITLGLMGRHKEFENSAEKM